MLEQDVKQAERRPPDQPAASDDAQEWEEAGEEEVPTIVLYVVAGLLLISFTMYLAIGGGHNHFH